MEINHNERKPILVSVGSEKEHELMFSFDKDENNKIKKYFVVLDNATESNFITMFDDNVKELKTKED